MPPRFQGLRLSAQSDSSIKLPPNYTNVSVVGSGGMGVVLRAEDSSLDRTVAIKVIRAGAFDAKDIKRFLSEARALSRLNHENIIKVLAIGQLDQMQPYMVLEYVEGESLDKILEREHFMPISQATGMFEQLVAALQHAHSEGVIHRDLKPSNILVSQEPGCQPRYRLVDFGIARISGVSITNELTQAGSLIGSPQYSSPEQCVGEKVDQRSDIYSLGCVMFEVLAGRPPFDGDNVLELISNHCSEDPPRIRDVNRQAEVNEGLERIIRKCLNKNPEDRYPDVSALAAALQRGDSPDMVRCRIRIRTPRTARKFIPYVAGVLALLPITLGVLAWQAHQREEQAQLRNQQLRREAERFALEGNWWANRRSFAKSQIAYQKAFSRYDQLGDLAANHILLELGRVQLERGAALEAVSTLERGLNRLKKVLPREKAPARHRAFYLSLGEAYIEAKNYDQAEHNFRQAIHTLTLEKPISPEDKHDADRNYADLYAWLSKVFLNENKLSQAREMALKWKTTSLRLYDMDEVKAADERLREIADKETSGKHNAVAPRE